MNMEELTNDLTTLEQRRLVELEIAFAKVLEKWIEGAVILLAQKPKLARARRVSFCSKRF